MHIVVDYPLSLRYLSFNQLSWVQLVPEYGRVTGFKWIYCSVML